MDKAVIVMTDGLNEPWSIRAEADADFAQECEAMKAEGIIIYTIIFQRDDPSLDALFQACATDPSYYYKSPTNEDLEQAFRTIGAQLSQLRLAE